MSLFYTFKGERKIIEKQNKYSEFALSELAVHIEDGFIYEKMKNYQEAIIENQVLIECIED